MGKSVVLTSSTAGIGRGIAQAILSSKGPDVDHLFINYGHSDEVAQEALMSFPPDKRDKVVLIKSDMFVEEGMKQLVHEVLQHTNKIDWLILNTGIGVYVPFEEYDLALWNHVMAANVSVPAMLVKELKPRMAQGGKVLFTGSYAGSLAHSTSVAYGVSKAAVHFLAKSLVKEFVDKQVTVNAIAPGFIETRWQDTRTQESRDRINSKVACHRFGAIEEVASLCMHVLQNDYINGAVLAIDGGYNYC